MAGKWRTLGIALRIKAAKLNMISSENDTECLRNTILAWIQQQDYDTKRFGQPSWKLLCLAIHKPAGCNNPGLARKIADKHIQAKKD